MEGNVTMTQLSIMDLYTEAKLVNPGLRLSVVHGGFSVYEPICRQMHPSSFFNRSERKGA